MRTNIFFIFSSPEYNMLKVSFCGRQMSFVHRQHLPCGHSRGHILFNKSTRNLIRMFVLIKSQTSSNLGSMGLKTRSQGQIKEVPCGRSGDTFLAHLT